MLTKVYHATSIICIFIFFTANEKVIASHKNTPPSFEEMDKQVGYKSVRDAVKEFENHFKRNVQLPTVNPPISFTHRFARFYEDKEYEINDFLEIKFVNKTVPDHNYKIDIRPTKNKLVFNDKYNPQVYILENGQKSIYFEHLLFNFLVFEKNNWQYILGIEKKVSNKVTPAILVQIANSIE